MAFGLRLVRHFFLSFFLSISAAVAVLQHLPHLSGRQELAGELVAREGRGTPCGSGKNQWSADMVCGRIMRAQLSRRCMQADPSNSNSMGW
jgi:hypothetical protein